jgi:hypothetical protein
MGACISVESAEEAEQKKKSRAIDQALEEDARRLRRECKILLLGKYIVAIIASNHQLIVARFWRKRQIYHRKTDENHPSEWIHG